MKRLIVVVFSVIAATGAQATSAILDGFRIDVGFGNGGIALSVTPADSAPGGTISCRDSLNRTVIVRDAGLAARPYGFRLLADGTLDSTYGIDGRMVIPIFLPPVGYTGVDPGMYASSILCWGDDVYIGGRLFTGAQGNSGRAHIVRIRGNGDYDLSWNYSASFATGTAPGSIVRMSMRDNGHMYAIVAPDSSIPSLLSVSLATGVADASFGIGGAYQLVDGGGALFTSANDQAVVVSVRDPDTSSAVTSIHRVAASGQGATSYQLPVGETARASTLDALERVVVVTRNGFVSHAFRVNLSSLTIDSGFAWGDALGLEEFLPFDICADTSGGVVIGGSVRGAMWPVPIGPDDRRGVGLVRLGANGASDGGFGAQGVAKVLALVSTPVGSSKVDRVYCDADRPYDVMIVGRVGGLIGGTAIALRYTEYLLANGFE